MIALQGISQTRYIIDDENFTCYTDDENRMIAILILKGEQDSIMLINSYRTIESLEAEVISLEGKISIMKLTEKLHEDAKVIIKEQSKVIKKQKRILIGSYGVVGIVAILLLI